MGKMPRGQNPAESNAGLAGGFPWAITSLVMVEKTDDKPLAGGFAAAGAKQIDIGR